MNVAVRIEENVVRLYVPDYRDMASTYKKQMMDEKERGIKRGNRSTQIYLWMIRCS